MNSPEAPRLISAAQVREQFGGISAMTEYRWRKAGILPKPLTIRARCYYRSDQIEAAFERIAAHAA